MALRGASSHQGHSMADDTASLIISFHEALNETDPAAQAAYLDRACSANPGLRRRVAVLLAAYASTGGVGDSVASSPHSSPTAVSPSTPHALLPDDQRTIGLSTLSPASAAPGSMTGKNRP